MHLDVSITFQYFESNLWKIFTCCWRETNHRVFCIVLCCFVQLVTQSLKQCGSQHRIVCIYKTCFHYVLCHIFHLFFTPLIPFTQRLYLQCESAHFECYGRQRMQMSGQMLYGPKTITWKYIYRLHAKFRFGCNMHIILQQIYVNSTMLKVTGYTRSLTFVNLYRVFICIRLFTGLCRTVAVHICMGNVLLTTKCNSNVFFLFSNIFYPFKLGLNLELYWSSFWFSWIVENIIEIYFNFENGGFVCDENMWNVEKKYP